MPFIKTNIDNVIDSKKNTNPNFKKLWDDSREEYRLIGEITALRKNKKITQEELATKTGTKQQVISRIENKEHHPSLRSFCNILSALGYELQIVKSKNI